jgi:hypothetical protein
MGKYLGDLRCISSAASEHVTVHSSNDIFAGLCLCILQYGDNSGRSDLVNSLVGKHTNIGWCFVHNAKWTCQSRVGFYKQLYKTRQMRIGFV